MLRRLIITGFVAALAAPVFAIAPAHASVLFSCTSGAGGAGLTPGLGNTPTHQTDVGAIFGFSSCSNGESGSVGVGAPSGYNTVASVANANGNLTCTTNPPNNTPIITGLTDPAFNIAWGLGGPVSAGIIKIKSSGTIGTSKAVLVINSGKYAPPLGQKTKVKAAFAFAPANGSCSDADPTTNVSLTLSGTLIVQQA
jgi:hypothetical protein